MEVIVKCVAKEGARVPSYKTAGAAGADIEAFVPESVTLPPGGRALIPTGVFIEVPEGYEAQVRPRSGLASKYGVTVINSPGTIDSDYRGEVKVPLANLGEEPFTVKNGDRIAQMVISPVARGVFSKVESLSETERGEGGFGSTGRGGLS